MALNAWCLLKTSPWSQGTQSPVATITVWGRSQTFSHFSATVTFFLARVATLVTSWCHLTSVLVILSDSSTDFLFAATTSISTGAGKYFHGAIAQVQ